jgi:hypothetical protein
MSTPLIIPPPASLREEIRTRTAQVRALKRLLRLAEAADAAQARRNANATPAPQEVGHER